MGAHPFGGTTGGKRPRRSVDSAGTSLPRNKFYLHDRNSGRQYLVDTGATDSVFPATEEDRKRHQGQSMGAANSSPIKTYGVRDIMLNFGDGHRFTQTFIVCDVSQPMLGFDFFKNNRLKIDVDELKLEYKDDGNLQRGSGRLP